MGILDSAGLGGSVRLDFELHDFPQTSALLMWMTWQLIKDGGPYSDFVTVFIKKTAESDENATINYFHCIKVS